LETNPVAEMIIDIAKYYPEIVVENTQWYKVNNEITSEIERERERKREREEELIIIQERREREIEEELRIKEEGGYFSPIVLTNPKRYKCPICNAISGTDAPKNPEDASLFVHYFDCINKFKKLELK